MTYDNPEVQEIADLFRSIDQRTQRIQGLVNARRLVYTYLSGDTARDAAKAIDALIAKEAKDPRAVGIATRRRMRRTKKG